MPVQKFLIISVVWMEILLLVIGLSGCGAVAEVKQDITVEYHADDGVFEILAQLTEPDEGAESVHDTEKTGGYYGGKRLWHSQRVG